MSKPRKFARIVRPEEVCQALAISRQGLWKMRRSGDIPAPLQFGRNSIGWREDDLAAWLDSRPKAA